MYILAFLMKYILKENKLSEFLVVSLCNIYMINNNFCSVTFYELLSNDKSYKLSKTYKQYP